nr:MULTISPECIES: isochorismatase family protein [unclassified Cupriavidus]
MSRRALIVIDIQNDYFPGGRWTLSQMDRAADNAAALIAAMRMTHARRAIWSSKASRCRPRRPTRPSWPRSGLPMPASSRQGNGWMSSTLDRGPY